MEMNTLEHSLYQIAITNCHEGIYILIYFDVVGQEKEIWILNHIRQDVYENY